MPPPGYHDRTHKTPAPAAETHLAAGEMISPGRKNSFPGPVALHDGLVMEFPGLVMEHDGLVVEHDGRVALHDGLGKLHPGRVMLHPGAGKLFPGRGETVSRGTLFRFLRKAVLFLRRP